MMLELTEYGRFLALYFCASKADVSHSGKLFYAPVGDNPQKIIDLGTGTGIWAVDGQLT